MPRKVVCDWHGGCSIPLIKRPELMPVEQVKQIFHIQAAAPEVKRVFDMVRRHSGKTGIL
jgi:hypothetical protein